MVFDQLIVIAFEVDELPVGSLLDNGTVLEHDDLVGVFDCAQAMCYYDDSFALEKLLQIVHNGALVVGV